MKIFIYIENELRDILGTKVKVDNKKMSIYFEKVNRFANIDLPLPERKTSKSAGYDFVVAEDITIPSYLKMMEQLKTFTATNEPLTLDEISQITKTSKLKPTLVSTGMKCHLEDNQYLEISVRSSCPLKNWLIMANGSGKVDSDYYSNPDNDGEIFFQIINLSPFDIILHKGDRIGQGIIYNYLITDDDKAEGIRQGGFGSTGH